MSISSVEPQLKTVNVEGKGKNKYRFHKLQERLGQVNVDISHRIQSIEIQPDQDSSFFLECFIKWRALNLTSYFREFAREIKKYVQSLPLILYHKKEVTRILLHHLRTQPASIQPALLELLTALARDLREEFYPLLGKTLLVLTSLVNPESPEELERLFSCLAYLFKFLLKYLVKDVDSLFMEHYHVLLSYPKDYVRRFAAETFAFLLRKLTEKRLRAVLLLITELHLPKSEVQDEDEDSTSGSPNGAMTEVKENGEGTLVTKDDDGALDRLQDGVAWVLFYLTKGVQNGFYSKISWIYPLYLDLLSHGSEEQVNHRSLILLTTNRRMANFARGGQDGHLAELGAPCVWPLLLPFVQNRFQIWQQDHNPTLSEELGKLLGVVRVWVQHRGGSRITDVDQVTEFVVSLLKSVVETDHSYGFVHSALALFAAFWNLPKQVHKVYDALSPCIATVFLLPRDRYTLLLRGFVSLLRSSGPFGTIARPAIFQCSEELLGIEPKEGVSMLLELLGDSEKGDDYPSAVSQEAWFVLPTSSSRFNRPSILARLCNELSAFCESKDDFSVPHLWACAHLLPRLALQSSEVSSAQLAADTLGSLLAHISKSSDPRLGVLRTQATISWIHVAMMHPTVDYTGLLDKKIWENLFVALQANPQDVAVLKEAVSYAYFLQSLTDESNKPATKNSTKSKKPKKSGKNVVAPTVFNRKTLEDLLPVIAPNLSSPHLTVRRLTASLLALFPPLEFVVSAANTKSELTGECLLFKSVEECFRLAPSVNNQKSISSCVARVQTMVTSTRVPPVYLPAALHFFLGVFQIKFSPIWPTAKAAISAMAASYAALSWPIYRDSLAVANRLARVAVPVEEQPRDVVKIPKKKPVPEAEVSLSPASPAEITLDECCTHWQSNEDRATDFDTMQRLFLSTIWEEQTMTTLGNKRGQELIDMMFVFFREFEVLFPPADSQHKHLYTVVSGKKGAKAKLLLWLKLAAKTFSRQTIAKVTQRAELHDKLLQFLAMSEPEIQDAALDVLLKFDFPYLTPYGARLHRLIDEKTYRDEMVMFHLSADGGVVAQEHRADLAPILTRVLFPKLVKRKTTKSKSTLHARRSAVLSFLGGLDEDELLHLIYIILNPFEGLLRKAFPSGGNTVKQIVEQDDLDARQICETKADIPRAKQLGFLSMLELVLSQLRSLLGPVLPIFGALVMWMLRNADTTLRQRHGVTVDGEVVEDDDEDDDDEGEEKHHEAKKIQSLKNIRQLCVKRFASMLNAYPVTLGTRLKPLTELYLEVTREMVNKLPIEGVQHRGGLLNSFVALAEHAVLVPVFVEHSPQILPSLFQAMGSKHVCQPVVHAALDVIEYLLAHEEKKESAHKRMIRAKHLDSDEEEDEALEEVKDEVSPETRLELQAMWQKHVPELLSAIHGYLNIVLHEKQTTIISATGRTQTRRRPFPKRELDVISKISHYATDSATAHKLVDLLLPCLASTTLDRSSRDMKRNARTSILTIVRDMVPLLDGAERLFSFLSRQFLVLKENFDRALVGSIFVALAKKLPELQDVAPILADLTALDAQHINQIDYEKRMAGYSLLRSKGKELSQKQLTPIVYAILADLYHEELGVRSNATQFLTALIDRLQETEPEPCALLTSIVFPTLKTGLKSPSETVRREMVKVLSHLVRKYSSYFRDLAVVTNESPDLDFFENITHLQVHRRRKALIRLRGLIEEGQITAQATSHVLLPLIQHFVYEQQTDQSLVEEALKTMGLLSSLFRWAVYNSTIVGIIKQIQQKSSLERILVRLLCNILDNWHFDLTLPPGTVIPQEEGGQLENKDGKEQENGRKHLLLDKEQKRESKRQKVAEAKQELEVKQESVEAKEEAEEDAGEGDEEEQDQEQAQEQERFEGEEPAEDQKDDSVALKLKIRSAITNRLLPQLSAFIGAQKKGKLGKGEQDVQDLEEKGDGPMLRVPVAMAYVKLLKKLPQDIVDLEFPRLLTVLCGHLNTRNQTARDVVRTTLVGTLQTMGPKYLWFIVTTLKEALTRGFQLHVLGYVVHSLLFTLSQQVTPGEIDHCVPLLMPILMEDLLGTVAQEKTVDKIRNSMREARKAHAPDSLALLSQMIVFRDSAKGVLNPLKEVLLESNSLNVVSTVTDALNHISIGFFLNPSMDANYLLEMLREMVADIVGPSAVKQDPSALTAAERAERFRVTAEETYEIQMTAKTPLALNKKNNTHTLTVFALHMLHTLFRKNRIDIAAAGSLLDPFVELITKVCLNLDMERKEGQAQTQMSQDVINIALKCSCYLLRSPLPSSPQIVPNLAAFCFRLLQECDPKLLRCCFNALAVIVRYCQFFDITSAQIQLLLSFVEQDMSQTSKQAEAFTLLKALLSRKVPLPDGAIIQKVCELMVVSDTLHVQQQCASVLLQYLMDYPLLPKQVQRHLSFFINNLSYPRTDTRLVLVELMHALIVKFPAEVIDDYAEFLFLPLVLRLSNDPDAKCRSVLANTIKQLLEKATNNKKPVLITFCLEWYRQTNSKLRQVAAQVFGLTVEALGSSNKHFATFLELLEPILAAAPVDVGKEMEEDSEEDDWKLLYYSLVALEKMVAVDSAVAELRKWPQVWSAVCQCNLHPHVWVRQVAARILGVFFGNINPEQFSDVNFAASTLLASNDELFNLSRVCTKQLGFFLTEKLAEQAVKNLVFLGMSMHSCPEFKGKAAEGEEEDPEEEKKESTSAQLALPPSDNRGLNWLFRRISFLTRNATETVRDCGFRWFAAMISRLEPSEIEPYLLVIINPLFRVADNDLAKEVMELLRDKVGPSFLVAYEHVREQVGKVRQDRKVQRKQLSVVDPAAAASKRVAKNSHKRLRKKEKIAEAKREPGKKKKRTGESNKQLRKKFKKAS